VANLADRAETDQALEAAVRDGEDTIIREHKLWLARRGDVVDWRAQEEPTRRRRR
jgi:hypothetical protein